MDKIANTLKSSLGLSEKESGIYLALLELGEGTVIEVAKKAALKRTTVYNLLPEMVRSGLVNTAINKKRRFYYVDDVRKLKNQLAEKEKMVDSLLPELQAIHNILPNKPKITYYEGAGGLRDLYWDTLSSTRPGEYIFAYTGMEKFYEIFPVEFAKEYIAERIKRKIPIRMIAPKSPAAEDWLKTARESLREIKLIDNANLHFKADMEIYANKVALITYVPDFIGVIIENREINSLLKSAFETMWNSF